MQWHRLLFQTFWIFPVFCKFQETDPAVFSDSWRTNPNECQECLECRNQHNPCEKLNDARKRDIRERCSVLVSRTGEEDWSPWWPVTFNAAMMLCPIKCCQTNLQTLPGVLKFSEGAFIYLTKCQQLVAPISSSHGWFCQVERGMFGKGVFATKKLSDWGGLEVNFVGRVTVRWAFMPKSNLRFSYLNRPSEIRWQISSKISPSMKL